jgi:predicted nucleic acid-binding protein
MTGPVFVDASVLVYARDARDPEKQRRAEEWLARLWEGRTGRLSSQVLHEYYVTVTAKLKPGMPAADARSDVRALLAWLVSVRPGELMEAAWHEQDQSHLSWWDALIVAAAKGSGCRALLTEDLQAGQDFGGLVVISPFSDARA